MRVGVGSRNPVKVEATESALAGLGATAEPVAVESGVPEQPWGDAETVQGAKNRARRALAAGDYDLGVGVEGGVARADGADGLFLVMWAAVTDGDRTGLGAGPRLRLPADVADHLAAGDELGPVMDDLTGDDGVKHDRGAAGVLTAGIVDREEALASAVAGALGPFVTDHYGGPANANVDNETTVRLEPAGPGDLDRVESLLDDAGLPTADVRDGVATFFLAHAVDDGADDGDRYDAADDGYDAAGEPVGVGGLEVDGPVALLRSVAVEPSARGEGHGTAVTHRLVDVADSLGVRECYLLTTDAAGFFADLGFERVDRDAVPGAIRETTQFAELCPSSAVAMRRELD